ncbi:MAG: hypothetical protein ACTSPO_07625, partial [Candidatus Heimdallarchaeaceae archaeon]
NVSRSRKEALTIMKETKNISQSEYFASLILKQTKENKDFYSKGLVYINLTLLYLNNDDIVNAEKNLAKAEKCATDVGDGSLSSVVSHTREKVRENSKSTQLEPPASKEEKPVIPPIRTISQEEKDANVKKVISAISNKDVPEKGPYVYRGLWEFKCSKCNNKWTLPDIRAPSSEEYSLPDKMHEICPKCNGTNIEKKYKSKKMLLKILKHLLVKMLLHRMRKKWEI